jgi:hypothetical protein
MHAYEPPGAVLPHQNVSGSELTVVGLTTVGGFLIMDADHHCAIAKDARLGVAPIHGRRNKIAIPIAIQPLGFVEYESHRPDEDEVVLGHGVQGCDILSDLGLSPALSEPLQLSYVVVHRFDTFLIHG